MHSIGHTYGATQVGDLQKVVYEVFDRLLTGNAGARDFTSGIHPALPTTQPLGDLGWIAFFIFLCAN